MSQTRRQFVRTLFVASQALAVGSLVPRSLFASDGGSDRLAFLVVGDWGRRGEKGQSQVARQMGLEAMSLRPRFVVSVGDNFYEDGVASVDDPHWRESFENIYSAESLEVPWHVVLGNHDYHGNCQAQIDYSNKSRRWNMPSRYFLRSETVAPGCDADLFFLDTTPMANTADDSHVLPTELSGQSVETQMAWLESSLEKSKADWKIVIAHHPVFSGGVHGDTPFLVERVLPLLKRHGVQAFFNGHDHDLQHLESGGVNFFCSGAGSAVRETSETKRTQFAIGNTQGFISVALAPEQMELRMIDREGRGLYSCVVPVAVG